MIKQLLGLIASFILLGAVNASESKNISYYSDTVVAKVAAVVDHTSMPNIILILADDMGVGELSHEGGLVATPSLDQMAKEGLRFTDAHTSSSVCTPTRYGILTGRYNWRSRLKSGVLTAVNSKALMDPNRVNLPTFLQKEGYATAMFGKWHLGVDWQLLSKDANPEPEIKKTHASWLVDYSKPFKNGPLDIGFDEAFFIQASLDMPPYLYLQDDRAVSVPTKNRFFLHNEYNDYHRIGAGAADFDANKSLATWASKSREFIKTQAQNTEQPFFLYLPLTSPHTPIVPGEKFKGMHPNYSWYADFIAETDWVVGQVLEQLKASGIDDNTLVIFTADNGFAPYVEIPKMMKAGYRPSKNLRGNKGDLYEGGHRVPFLVRWPNEVRAGSKSDVTISTTDFYATFADLLGKQDTIADNAAEDSFSFYPSLINSSDQTNHQTLNQADHRKNASRPFTIHHSISGKFAIRKGEWKLLLAPNSGGFFKPILPEANTPSNGIQLYNLKDDPSESENLEGQFPEIEKMLITELANALHNGRTTPGEKQTNDGWPYRDKATLNAFPALSDK